MGPSHTRDPKPSQSDMKTLLREKDDRIATLETRLEAYSARTSTAHTRLLKTIDVLDALRSQHALEISAEEQAKIKLVQDVNHWRIIARNLEVERDELKDVVEDLIKKVQVSNEWNEWPCSRMHITKHAGNLNVEFSEQVVSGVIAGDVTKVDYNSDLLAYASSIIARLRAELDIERQNHSKTVEEANLRVEELEAKIAVREAELEKYVTSPGGQGCRPGEPQNVPTQSSEKRNLEKMLPEPKPLSDEECFRFLENNCARNRSLEIEIRQIAERLERARIAESTPSGPRKEPLPLGDGRKSIAIPSPRTRSASVDPSALSRPSDSSKVVSSPVATSPATVLSIAQLDNRIRTMTTQVDALVSERMTLVEAAARQRRVTEGIDIDTFQDILRVEGECVRLQAEADDLREQLQHAHSSARAREKVLLREIERLRASSSSSVPAHDLHRIFSPQPLEDDIGTEESMELASPLTPTIVPNLLPADSSQNADSEAVLVSFPFSPRYVSSPAPEVKPTSPRATCHSPGPQDVERVQAALDVARTHLAQKEEALIHLRAEMEKLQQEVQAQSRGDGDGG